MPSRRNRSWWIAASWVVCFLAFAMVADGGPSAAAAQEQNDADAVRSVFESYKRALMMGDGKRAVELVDQETLSTFEHLRELAVGADEATVRSLSFVERLLVLSIRHSFTAAQMQQLSMADLIQTAVDRQWLQPATVAGLSIGTITIVGDDATAQAISMFNATPSATPEQDLAYGFVREDGTWKFRFGRLLRELDELVGSLFRQLGADEDAILLTLIESLTGGTLQPQSLYSPNSAAGAGEPTTAPPL